MPRTACLFIPLSGVLLRVGIALYLGNDMADIRGGTHDQISCDAPAQRADVRRGQTAGASSR